MVGWNLTVSIHESPWLMTAAWFVFRGRFDRLGSGGGGR